MPQLQFFTEAKHKLRNVQKCPDCGSKIYLLDCYWLPDGPEDFRLFLKFGCKECGLEGDFEEWRDRK